MDRRSFLCASALGIFVAAVGAEAQQARKIWRIGYLSGLSEDQSIKARELFVQALRNVGYEPGTNVDIEYRYAAADAERLRAMANELVHLSVDVVVVFGIAAASAAKKATTTIPIVMAVAADPGRVGLVQNLAKPGGNVTGVVTVSEALAGKRLQLLKEAVPNLVRVAVLLNPSFPVNAPLLEIVRQRHAS